MIIRASVKSHSKAYGGELLKKRSGRTGARPIAVRQSMHLVLRSSLAKGRWSFLRAANRRRVESIVTHFSRRYGVRLLSFANVGNHLHFHIQLPNRASYRPFIRAMTAAIAMAVTGVSRWSKPSELRERGFWDYRPFTRVVVGFRAVLRLRDYLWINRLEGYGLTRSEAHWLARERRNSGGAQPLELETG